MPIIIKIKERNIKLTEDIKKILTYQHEALQENKLLNESNEVLTGGEAKAGEGFAPLIKGFFERITNTSFGAKEIKLPARTVLLDPPADKLREEYIVFLNTFLPLVDQGPEEAQNVSIDTPFILIREILLRFMTIALSVGADNYTLDGEKLVQAMRVFVQKLMGCVVIDDKRWFRSNSAFKVKLALDHKAWMDQIEQVVKIVRVLHAPSTAFNHISNYLRQARYVIRRQLAARLDHNITFAAMGDEHLTETLNRCETACLIKHENVARKNKALSQHAPKTREQTIIALLSTEEEQKKVECLYVLLKKTDLFSELVGSLDILTSATGWVALLTGAVKPKELGRLMKIFEEECQILDLKAADVLFSKETLSGRNLTAYSSATTELLGTLASASYSNLDTLSDNGTITSLKNFIRINVENIRQLQALMGYEGNLIDNQLLTAPIMIQDSKDLTQLSHVPPASTSSSSLAPRPSSSTCLNSMSSSSSMGMAPALETKRDINISNPQKKRHVIKMLQQLSAAILTVSEGIVTELVPEMKEGSLMPAMAIWNEHGYVRADVLSRPDLNKNFAKGMYLCRLLDEAEHKQAIKKAIKTSNYANYASKVEGAHNNHTLPNAKDILLLQVLSGAMRLLERDKEANFDTLRNWLDALNSEPLRSQLVQCNDARFYKILDEICDEIGVTHISADIQDPLAPFCEAAKNVLLAFVVKQLNYKNCKADCSRTEQQGRAKQLLISMQNFVLPALNVKDGNVLIQGNHEHDIKKAIAKSRNFGRYSDRADQADIFINKFLLTMSGRTTKEEGSGGIRTELLADLTLIAVEQLVLVATIFNSLEMRTDSITERLIRLEKERQVIVKFSAHREDTSGQWKAFFTEVLNDLEKCTSVVVTSPATLPTSSVTPIETKGNAPLLLSETISLVPKRRVAQLLLSAAVDDVKAQFSLARAYQYGEHGLMKNAAEAVRWYRQAAHQQHLLSIFELGRCYFYGEGIDRDIKLAAQWCHLADGKIDEKLQHTLKAILLEAKLEEEAVEWYKKNAMVGNSWSQYCLAECYAQGIGREKDSQQAAIWYKKAAEQGQTDAKNSLASLLQKNPTLLSSSATVQPSSSSSSTTNTLRGTVAKI